MLQDTRGGKERIPVIVTWVAGIGQPSESWMPGLSYCISLLYLKVQLSEKKDVFSRSSHG